MDKKYKLPNGDIKIISLEEEEQFLSNNPGAIIVTEDLDIKDETSLSQENQKENKEDPKRILVGEQVLSQKINTPGNNYMGMSSVAYQGVGVKVTRADGVEVPINLSKQTYDDTDPVEFHEQEYNKLIELQKWSKENKDNPFISSGASAVFSKRKENVRISGWGRKHLRQINNLIEDTGYEVRKSALTYELIKNDEVILSADNPGEIQKWAYDNFTEEDYTAMQPKKQQVFANSIDEFNTQTEIKRQKVGKMSDDDIINDLHNEGTISSQLLYLIDQKGVSKEGAEKIKNLLNTPVTKSVRQTQYDWEDVPIKDWKRARYNNILSDIKDQITPEDYNILSNVLMSNPGQSDKDIERYRDKVYDDSVQNIYEQIFSKSFDQPIISAALEEIRPQFNRDLELYSNKKEIFENMFTDNVNTVNSSWDSIVKEVEKSKGFEISTMNPNTSEEYSYIIGEGDDETKLKLQKKISEWYDSRKTIYESLAQEKDNLNNERLSVVNKYQDLQDNEGNLIDINELSELAGKQFDLESIFVAEVLGGFEKAKLSIPAMFGHEVSLQRYEQLMDNKSAFETMLEWDQGIEEGGLFGRGGRFVVRTIGEQGSNLALTLGGAAVGVPVPLLAGGIYAPQAGADKRVEINSRFEAAQQAKILSADLDKRYKNGDVPLSIYLDNKKKYETLIATGDLDQLQINKAIAASFFNEFAFTSVFGTAVISKKIIGDLAGKQTFKSTLAKLKQKNFLKANSFEFGKRIGSEVVEETGIYTGDQILDNLITGKEKDWSKIDDTAISALILSSTMSGPTLAYNAVVMNHAKGKILEDINSQLKEFDDLQNILVDPKTKESDKNRVSTKMKQILLDIGFVASGLEVDALLVGSEGAKQLIENSVDLNVLYKEADIKPGDSENKKKRKINRHLKSLNKSDADNFRSKLKLIRDSEYQIKSKAREKLRGDIFAEGGIIEQLYGKNGLDIANKILAKNPDFAEKSPRQQLAVINRKHQEAFIKSLVEDAKKDRTFIDSKTGKKTTKQSDIKRAVEFLVYGKSFEKSGRKKRKKKEEDAVYEQLVKLVNTDVVRSFTNFKNDSETLKKIINKYGDLKNLKIVGLNEEDGESRIVEILTKEGNSASDVQMLLNELKEGSSNGFVTTSGNYIVVNKESAEANIEDGNLLQGTVWMHETSHALDNVTMKEGEKKTYTINLFEYMSENSGLKGVHDEATQRAILLGEYNPDKPINKQSDVFYDEYVKYVQDILTVESRKPGSKIWKEARKASASFGNMFRGTMIGGKIPIIGRGGDFTLETPQDAMNYLASFIHSWNMDQDLSEQTLRKMKAMEGEQKPSGKELKSSNVEGLLNRFDINKDNFTNRKLERMINEVISKKKDGNPIDFVKDIDAIKQSEFGQEIMPIVESITKRLFDPIPSNIAQNAGVTRGSFQTELISMAGTLVSNEYNFKQPIDKFISTRLNLRANKLASDLGIKSVEESAKETRMDQRFAGEDSQMQIEDTTQEEQPFETEEILKEESKRIRGIETKDDGGRVVNEELDLNSKKVSEIKSTVKKANVPLDNLTYKGTKKLIKDGPLNKILDIVAEEFGVEPSRIRDDQDLDGKQREAIRKRIVELSNKGKLIDLLPEGTDSSGKATGVPPTILNKFYIKTSRAKVSKGATAAGLPVQVKNPNITNEQFLDAFGINPDGTTKKGASLDGALRGFVLQMAILEANQQIRNNATEQGAPTPIVTKVGEGKSEFVFSKNPEIDKIINLKDLFDIEVNGKDKVLEIHGINKTFKITKEEDIDLYIDQLIKNKVFKIGPKEMFFGPGDHRKINSKTGKPGKVSSVFTHSAGRDQGLRGKNKPKDADKLYSIFKKKILDLKFDENIEFGKSIPGVKPEDMWSLRTEYDAIFTFTKDKKKISSPSKARKNIKRIEEFNKKVEAIHRVMWSRINKIVNEGDKSNATGIAMFLGAVANDTGHWHKLGAQIVGFSSKIQGKRFEYEHAMPATAAYLYLLDSALDNDVDFNAAYDLLIDNYKLIALDKAMDDKLRNARTESGKSLQRRMPDNWSVIDNKWWERYFNGIVAEQNGGIDPFSIETLDGRTLGKTLGIKADGITTVVKSTKPEVKKIYNSRNAQNNTIKYTKTGKVVGMSTFDFDETLIIDGENFVVATDPKTGEKINIKSGEWPTKGPELAAQGYKFNFDDFVNVRGGVDGPLLQKMKNQIKKYGPENVFVLTARPQEADIAIHEWLKSKGIKIPFKNITGLAQSEGQAKADWMLEKFAEGYNDMYFVDDALPNVKAVKNVLEQLDIKSKVVQAKIKFSKNAPLDFNKILEQTKGIDAGKRFSVAEARKRGIKNNKFTFFVPPSAEDFKGLLYSFLGKGRQGDAHMKFFKDNLLDPYAKGYRNLNAYKQAMSDDYKVLKDKYKGVGKILNKKVKGTSFTNDSAVRVYLWNKAGFEIPGISKTLQDKLIKQVNDNVELREFADALSIISRTQEGYVKPNEYWIAETIANDLVNIVNNVGRKDFLAEWINNKNLIFSPENMNKIEAIYGSDFRDALENMLYRMETGSNRTTGKDKTVNMFLDWINGSVGATMFFNIRSAALQTISTVNFINASDNNMFRAAAAFANQVQFWKDFAYIFNSDMLKQRRAGLQIDVSASELTKAFADGRSKPQAVIAYLLEKGFLPTQIADSFAIAMGGSTFYRNRIKKYTKQGMSKTKAKEQAWLDFQEIAEETQQSSRPDLISMQQAGPIGRIILAWQNTPMQMTRLTKKSISDLVNRRRIEGLTQFQSDKANISRIMYYALIQNLIFGALQTGLAFLMFGWDEDEERKKKLELRVANGALDTILRGTGVYGAGVAALKNTLMKWREESQRGWKRDDLNIALEAVSLSPPIGSKMRKLMGAARTEKYNKGVSKEIGFRIENPNLSIAANWTEALLNIPVARVVNKANNVEEAITGNHDIWQRVAMVSGWSRWSVGVKDEEIEAAKKSIEDKKKKAKEDKKKAKEKKKVRCRRYKDNGQRCKNKTNNKNQRCYAHQ